MAAFFWAAAINISPKNDCWLFFADEYQPRYQCGQPYGTKPTVTTQITHCPR